MKFKMVHENYNVYDLQRSLDFYEKALGLTEKRRMESEDGSFIIVYVANSESDFELELTWLKDMIWVTVSSIWLFMWTIMNRPTSSMRKWDVSAMRIRRWEFILSQIRTDTGSRLFLRKNKGKCYCK